MMMTVQKVGDEFLVNSQTASYQYWPTITGLANGGFVVSWSDQSGTLGDANGTSIKAQLFDAAGTKVGTEFLVNTQPIGSQYFPTITGLANGSFVVSWEDRNQPIGVEAQIFSASGSKIGGEFLIHTPTTFGQGNPTITSLSTGGFVVSWAGPDSRVYDNNPALGSVKVQIFDATGVKLGGEIGVDNVISGEPTITGLSSGGFVVSWTDESSFFDGNIKAQIFSASGTKVGSEFLVNTQTANDQGQPTITGLGSGGFVVCWRDSSVIKAQVFDAVGTKIGTEFQVNSEASSSENSPMVTSLSTGGFVVSWHSNNVVVPGVSNSDGIKAQVFDATGTKLGGEFIVNSQTHNLQEYPTVTGLSTGGFVVSWQDGSGTLGDASSTSIKAQLFTFSDNATPTDISLSSASVDETVSTGQTVGYLSITDSDVNDVHILSIVADPSGGAFAIANGQLVVVDASLLDHETEPSVTLTIRATDIDGAQFDKDFSISVRDVKENYAVSGVGDEFLVNTQTANAQVDATVTSLSTGGFVVSWQDSSGTLGDANGTSIKAQMFDSSGNKMGTEFLVNSQAAGNQTIPTITSLNSGGFVVSWRDSSGTLGDASSTSIKAQMFNSAGIRVGSEFLVNTKTADAQADPTITGLSSGGFVVSWHDPTSAFEGNVKAQLFDVLGTKIGTEFVVNTEIVSTFPNTSPTVASLNTGGFVVSWEDRSSTLGDASSTGIKAQIFDSTGVKLGGEFLVNTQSYSAQVDPTITSLSTGGFVVSWRDGSGALGDANGTGIAAQIFDATGNKIGSEFLINNQTANNQSLPTISRLGSGGFVVSWEDNSGTLGDASGYSIKAQIFDATGTKLGGEFLVNTQTANNQADPTITGLSTGDFVVSWEDYSGTLGDASGASIKAQIFSVNASPAPGNDIIVTDEDTQVTFDVRTNDSDADTDPLTVTHINGAVIVAGGAALAVTNGAVALGLDGQLTFTPDANANGPVSFGYTVSDGNGGTADASVDLTINPVNDAPAITSNGSGDTAAISLAENGLAVTAVAADDVDGDARTYTIAGGADAALFGIDGATGALAFLTAPDFEAPGDFDGDNIYDVIVSASDGTDSDTQVLTVSVTNLIEGSTITGTEANDIINTKRVPVGQPKATALDDLIFGNGGNDNIDGGAGADQMHGGLGNDTFTIDNAGDQAIELADGGIDTIKSALVDLTLAANIEKGTLLDLLGVGADLGITGNDLANTLTGNRGANALAGGEGNDVLNGKDGNDTLFGDAGDDKLNGNNGDDILIGGTGIDFLTGGAGSDTLTGGTEADQFKFDKFMLADGLFATDTITDFSGLGGDGDRINLSAIDANGNALDGNQKFGFLGTAAFSGVAGQLRYEQSGGDTWLSGDLNGDSQADFQIIATGLHSFVAADFIL